MISALNSTYSHFDHESTDLYIQLREGEKQPVTKTDNESPGVKSANGIGRHHDDISYIDEKTSYPEAGLASQVCCNRAWLGVSISNVGL